MPVILTDEQLDELTELERVDLIERLWASIPTSLVELQEQRELHLKRVADWRRKFTANRSTSQTER